MAVSLRRVRFAALALATLALPACGAEAVVGPIIILTNRWTEVGRPEHAFQFNDDTDGTAVSEGTFTGTEFLPDGRTEYEFDGFWRGGRVEFTVKRGAQNVTYRGTITEDNVDRIEYTSSAGRLVLER